MNEKMYEKIEEKIEKELEKLAMQEQPLNVTTLDQLDKLLHALKNAYKVHMGYEGEYSGAGWDIHAYPADGRSMRGMPHGMSYNNGVSYNGGMSYHDGGMSYGDNSYRGRHRDSMGRYSSEGARDEMMSRLEEMMNYAQTDKEREAIRKCMENMRG